MNDLLIMPNIAGKASNHSLYSTADPAELKALSKNPNVGARLRKIAETIQEGDNPVLVVVELK